MKGKYVKTKRRVKTGTMTKIIKQALKRLKVRK